MKFYVWCTTISEQSERMRKGEYIINIFQNISFAFHFSQETRGRLDDHYVNHTEVLFLNFRKHKIIKKVTSRVGCQPRF